MNRQAAENFYDLNVKNKIDIYHNDQYKAISSKIENIINDCVLLLPSRGYKIDIKKFYLIIEIPYSNDGYQDPKDSYFVFNNHDNTNFIVRYLLSDSESLNNKILQKKLKLFCYSLGWNYEIDVEGYQCKIYISYPSNLLWFRFKRFFANLFNEEKL